ncbi:MAG: MoaD/ThiS family protein [Chthoniobacterales bacterium]|jgi:molybdopterin converting factor subunit 1
MRVLFFAQLKDVAGVDQISLAVDRLSAGALWDLLIARWPALAAHREQTRLARNGAYAEAGEVFGSEDEVALIPPVSGG